MAKQSRPRSWAKTLDRAARASAANKARLEAASSAGTASEKTLSGCGYDPDPSGGGPRPPRQVQAALARKRKKRRRR
jgi:imidazolonepropionase-like amidohydrolase